MKLIVGLGNPGPRYRGTRHNVGFGVLDALADRLGAAFSQEKHKSLLARAQHGHETLLLQKPMTYMNLSGTAVAAAARNKVHNFDSDLLVVVDDVNLPLGRLRFREDGSAGGHNGLKSVSGALRSHDYPRLRIGVGTKPEGEDLSDWVLSPMPQADEDVVVGLLPELTGAVELWIEQGTEAAMNRFNR